MFRQILPISSLLLGSALLLFAGGINSLILPIRGSAEGFSAASLGLLGTAWALGYVSGCLFTPRLVARVGHIRAFSVMAALAAVALLLSLVFLTPIIWLPLRALSGFCFAGAAMIVEGWLSERSDPSNRGRIFGIYSMVNLFASTAGQMSLTLGDTNGFLFFVLGGVIYCLALVPTSISSSATPKPLVSVKLDLPMLWRNSPVAVVGVFLIGISNSSFGTLAAVYADRTGLVLAAIALFASLPVLAGAVAQMPVGQLSDRMDRRKVLVGLAAIALLTDLVFIFASPESRMLNLVFVSLFGASIYAMYPVIVAHANDHAPDGTYIQTSGGLLITYGFGSIVGPLLAGAAMSGFGPWALFLITAASHAGLIGFTTWRILARAAVREADKGNFVMSPPARGTTPETAAMTVSDAEADKDRATDWW